MKSKYQIQNIKLLTIDNININLNIKVPDRNYKGILIITHGYGEHSGYYNEFSEYFAGKDILTVYYDLRSHGLSEGKRGHVPSFDLFLDDLNNVIIYTLDRFPNLPVYLFGHSMGGSIVLNYLLKKDVKNIQKGIISSPWLKLAFEPPKSKLLLARIGKILFPSLVMKGELKTEHLSNNIEFQKRFDNDVLTYDLISPQYYFEIREAGIWALENAEKIKTHILMSHGVEDKVTSIDASKLFCNKANEYCIFKEWGSGYKHVVYSEENKEEIFEFFFSYLVQK